MIMDVFGLELPDPWVLYLPWQNSGEHHFIHPVVIHRIWGRFPIIILSIYLH